MMELEFRRVDDRATGDVTDPQVRQEEDGIVEAFGGARVACFSSWNSLSLQVRSRERRRVEVRPTRTAAESH